MLERLDEHGAMLRRFAPALEEVVRLAQRRLDPWVSENKSEKRTGRYQSNFKDRLVTFYQRWSGVPPSPPPSAPAAASVEGARGGGGGSESGERGEGSRRESAGGVGSDGAGGAASGEANASERHPQEQQKQGGFMKCMASGMVLPQHLVRAAHIWKYATGGEGLEVFGLRIVDVHNTRNGLLVAEKVDSAFDVKRVGWEYDMLHDSFRFRVWDQELLQQPICKLSPAETAALRAHGAASGLSENAPEMTGRVPTYAELNGRTLEHPPGCMPYRRLMAWHYKCGHDAYVRQGAAVVSAAASGGEAAIERVMRSQATARASILDKEQREVIRQADRSPGAFWPGEAVETLLRDVGAPAGGGEGGSAGGAAGAATAVQHMQSGEMAGGGNAEGESSTGAAGISGLGDQGAEEGAIMDVFEKAMTVSTRAEEWEGSSVIDDDE